MDGMEIKRIFPAFSRKLCDELARGASLREAPRGTVLYEQGLPCEMVPLILQGQVRVYKIGETGREITLYRVQPGETCVLSSSCGLSGTDYPAIAEAEENVRLIMVPVQEFGRLSLIHPELQGFMTQMLSQRLSELMLVVEEVAFRRVDLRLAELMLHATASPAESSIERTHAQLAVELGSAREVVSRILKDFEHHGFLELGRGHIRIVDRNALQTYKDAIQAG
ncbi:MAG: Crp/Fnr family transcriptional regulator [Candidatus Lambdaproteobacteria bacterium]|nr:Crp/Fnr family transcriptional regulator [Candidatus Lambdaproteobacteria bacterium]